MEWPGALYSEEWASTRVSTSSCCLPGIFSRSHGPPTFSSKPRSKAWGQRVTPEHIPLVRVLAELRMSTQPHPHFPKLRGFESSFQSWYLQVHQQRCKIQQETWAKQCQEIMWLVGISISDSSQEVLFKMRTALCTLPGVEPSLPRWKSKVRDEEFSSEYQIITNI